jgi:hypothetical protein
MKYLKRFEMIKVPIKVGDTVLGGRFKNKKMVVKKIGKNAKGDITINDKPLLKFRLVKESIDELESEIRDILSSELPEEVNTDISRIRKDVEIDPERYFNKTRTDLYLEIYIRRPWNSPNRNIPGVVNPEGGYPGNLLFWYEIKEAIIRLTNWYYSVYAMYDPIDKDTELRTEKDKSPLRFFTSGIEMYIGFNKEEDFDKIDDFISFTSFRMVVKL